MADKQKDSSFKVTDRRLFTTEGDLREKTAEEETAEFPAITDVPPAKPKPQVSDPKVQEQTVAPPPAIAPDDLPPAPTADERNAQADAYRKSSQAMDSAAEKSGYSTKDLEITFERYMASLYMSAMLHLGLMHEQGGEPRIDIIGARQTIDTLSLISEKTRGNLTEREELFLQNCLYELRMAYVEVTKAIARGPQPAPATGTTNR